MPKDSKEEEDGPPSYVLIIGNNGVAHCFSKLTPEHRAEVTRVVAHILAQQILEEMRDERKAAYPVLEPEE